MLMSELQMGFSGMERDDWIQPNNHRLEITLIIDHLSHFVFWFGLFLITEIAINLISSELNVLKSKMRFSNFFIESKFLNENVAQLTVILV